MKHKERKPRRDGYKKGDLTRKATHEMRTKDGMCHNIDAKLTVRQVYGKMLGIKD